MREQFLLRNLWCVESCGCLRCVKDEIVMLHMLSFQVLLWMRGSSLRLWLIHSDIPSEVFITEIGRRRQKIVVAFLR